MVGEPKQSSSATTAVFYLTVGALMAVWSAVYFFWLGGRERNDTAYLWCAGFFFSGLVLVGIGLAVGQIGRAARAADVAPTSEVRVNAATAPQTPIATPVTGTQPAASAPPPKAIPVAPADPGPTPATPRRST